MRKTKSAFMALCAMGITASASAFEIEEVERLAIANGIAHIALVQDTEDVCAKVAESSLCRLEFGVADKMFKLVERLLFMAAISHDGSQEEQRFLKKAERRYEQAWILYQAALAENPVSQDAVPVPEQAQAPP